MSNEIILLVDDEKEIADLLAVYLKAENYEVRTFYNPLEALSCVEKEQVDLAILDVMMQIWMDLHFVIRFDKTICFRSLC